MLTRIAPLRHRSHTWAVQLGLDVVGLAAWFWTQNLIVAKQLDGGIGDGLLEWLGPANRYLASHAIAADWLLITSSAAINLLAANLVVRAHWTMDVFTGTVTALWVAGIAKSLAPRLDRLLA